MNLLQQNYIKQSDLPNVLAGTQAYIVFGHGCDLIRFGFVTFDPGAKQTLLRTAFAQLGARLTQAQAVAGPSRPSEVWAAGISSAGYYKMGFRKRLPWEFLEGFAKRVSRITLQDTSQWTGVWAGGARFDAVVVIAAQSARSLQSAVEDVAQIFAGLASVQWRDGLIRTTNGVRFEHFGFAEGTSQPVFFDGTSSRSTVRQYPWDPKAPLELVLVRDSIQTAANSQEYGSYCALVTIQQDIAKFQAAAAQLAVQASCTAQQAQEMIVGRRKNGDHLLPMGNDRNDVDVTAPDNERAWPLASHTRRMNPRDAPHRRILRRGVSYDFDNEQGLLFQSFQASIENQFEFLFRSWVNNPNRPKPGTGVDPIIGTEPNGCQEWPNQNGAGGMVHGCMHGLTTIRGGEYFYFPSIPAMKAYPEL